MNAQALPDTPGVYLMRDPQGRVIYAGKALSLRNRVPNYFQASSVLPLGSPFELALSLLCDLTVAELMLRLGRSNDDLAKRHTNLL